MRLSILALLAFASYSQAQLMDAALQKKIDKNLPTISNSSANDALHGKIPGRRLFYTSREIPHAQFSDSGNLRISNQNVAANPDGMPSTDFDFPWKLPSGTTDDTPFYGVKVMFLPGNAKVLAFNTVVPTTFANIVEGGRRVPRVQMDDGKPGTRVVDWVFPIDTVFFEILFFKDRMVPFEVRSRTKITETKWKMNLYRPFTNRYELDAVFKGLPGKPNVERQFEFHDKTHRNKLAFSTGWQHLEEVNGFETADERDEAMNRVFRSALSREWSPGVGSIPITKDKFAIIPTDYWGGLILADQDSCMRCHQDAQSHVRSFDRNREWYGFVRGSKTEKILSFRPIRVGDNKLIPELERAGLVAWSKK